MPTFYYAVLALAIMLLSACQSIVTSRYVTPYDQPASGILYGLPKEYIEIKLVRQLTTKDKLQALIKKTSEQIAQKKAAFADIEDNQIPALKASLSQGQLSAAARARFELEIELARLQQVLLKTAQSKLEKQLTSTQDQLKQLLDHPDNGKSVVDVFSFATKITVDSEHMLLAQIHHDGASSNDLDIKTTAAGLLSGGTVSSQGQVDEIIVAAAQAIAAVSGVPGGGQQISFTKMMPGASLPNSACQVEEKSYTFVLDPDADDPLGDLNQQLASAGLCYGFSSTALTAYQAHTSAFKNRASATPVSYDGLLYNRKMLVDLTVHQRDLSSPIMILGQAVKTYHAEISDKRYISLISMQKGYFADNKYEFEFKDGYLTRYAVTQPSEIVGALSMVPRALKALIEIPAEIIQLKIDYSSKEAAYEQAKAEVLKSRLQLQHYQQNEDAALAAALEESSGSEE
jgi:hypothetical protein